MRISKVYSKSSKMISFKQYLEACWKGYKQVGLKKKGDRMVPNCVPEEHGAGEEGTDKLVKRYKKDTPYA